MYVHDDGEELTIDLTALADEDPDLYRSIERTAERLRIPVVQALQRFLDLGLVVSLRDGRERTLEPVAEYPEERSFFVDGREVRRRFRVVEKK